MSLRDRRTSWPAPRSTCPATARPSSSASWSAGPTRSSSTSRTPSRPRRRTGPATSPGSGCTTCRCSTAWASGCGSTRAGSRRPTCARCAGAPALTGFVVAKTENVDELHDLDRLLASVGSTAGVVPLLESARAVLRRERHRAAPRGCGGCRSGRPTCAPTSASPPGPDERELLYARSHVVLASTAAGIRPPIAPVSTNFRDLDAFRASTVELAPPRLRRPRLHPPGAGRRRQRGLHARGRGGSRRRAALVGRWEFAGAGVAVDDDGRFVDEAVVRQARLVLARVGT